MCSLRRSSHRRPHLLPVLFPPTIRVVLPHTKNQHNKPQNPFAGSRPQCINSKADARLWRFPDSPRNLGPPINPGPHEYASRTTNNPLRPGLTLAIRGFPSTTPGTSTLVRDGTVLHFHTCSAWNEFALNCSEGSQMSAVNMVACRYTKGNMLYSMGAIEPIEKEACDSQLLPPPTQTRMTTR